jgi:purine-binding chemotaxis protein CheW
MEQQMVVFKLAGEHFGVDISAVESIIKMQAITRMPHTPSFVEGITNLRGTVLPVIDLKKRLGMEYQNQEPVSASDRDNRRIIVVNMNGRMVGMIVDAVEEVLKIAEESVAPPPPMVTTVDTAYVTGIIKVGERLIIRLELHRVLSTEESGQLQSI